mmetsp:Transcript_18820/g.31625  ORF Transcript_18820/g.31625 Transcript_18820/m.31625 type:complete len:266 (+) Transcript_18820:1971-2768(+)
MSSAFAPFVLPSYVFTLRKLVLVVVQVGVLLNGRDRDEGGLCPTALEGAVQKLVTALRQHRSSGGAGAFLRDQRRKLKFGSFAKVGNDIIIRLGSEKFHPYEGDCCHHQKHGNYDTHNHHNDRTGAFASPPDRTRIYFHLAVIQPRHHGLAHKHLFARTWLPVDAGFVVDLVVQKVRTVLRIVSTSAEDVALDPSDIYPSPVRPHRHAVHVEHEPRRNAGHDLLGPRRHALRGDISPLQHSAQEERPPVGLVAELVGPLVSSRPR